MSGSKMLVSDEEKRWVVVGIAMNKVVAPVLRDTIKQGMDTHYNNLDTHCNGLPVPCTLRTLTYHQASTDGTLKTLIFGNINNNSDLHGNKKEGLKKYDYSVSSSVDLAKLFLPDYLAKFAAFDESMDMSAILRLLGFCRPAPIFPSPNTALSIQSAADDVKDSVRNKWGHCDVSEWTEAFFNDCFTKLEVLVRSVGLTAGMEKIIVDQLSDWKTKGCQLCMGHAVDQSLLSLVQQEVVSLYNQHRAVAAQVGEQERSLDTILAQQDEQAKQVEEDKKILERLVYIERNVGDEIKNRIQQLGRGFAKFDKTVQQLKEDMAMLRGKTQDTCTAMAETGNDGPSGSCASNPGIPPGLSFKLPKLSDLVSLSTPWNEVELPVDALLLTVKDVELLSCYAYLKNPVKSYHKGLGYVYFGTMGEEQLAKVKVALVRCHENSAGPGGALTVVKNAAAILRPKVVFSVGSCASLGQEKAQLGDVVLSAKITTYSHKEVRVGQVHSCGVSAPCSRDIADIIRYAADGWQAPLENPEAREITVHCNGEFLSGPELVDAPWRKEELCKQYPKAVATEMEGEGVFSAAYDLKMEWIVVKGVSNYADGTKTDTAPWKPLACAMAASVVSHIFKDPSVFKDWLHYKDESTVQHKRPLSPSCTQDPKRPKLMPHTEASPVEPFDVETCRSKLADHYTRTARVPTTVWSSIHHVDIHQIYTRLSWVREEHTTTGSSQTKLKHYTDVFRQTENGVLPKRILVQGQAGIGKSTFVKKLSVDWAELHHGGSTCEQKEALRKFELVLVVKLRDVKQCQSPTDLISSSLILSKDDSTLMSGLLDFVAKNQEKVLLVLDGYDEYSGESESVTREIFQRAVLRDCCVLVTSRPSKADELRGFADVHAEITGFSYEDIKSFMRRMLGSEREASDLESCLCNRKLLDLACVPLLLLFYCTLWKKGKWESFPENRTELYRSVVQCLLDFGHGKRAAGCYSKVEDHKEILAEMGKVALEALLKDDLIFDYDKLSEAVQCEGSRIIGLLQVTEYAENERPAGKVSFIHKSIQEFLAAWYITYRCIPEGNLGLGDEAGNTFEKWSFFENVLSFVCGLSVDGAEKVFGLLKSVRMCDQTFDLLEILVEGGRERRFYDCVVACFREALAKEELLKHCLDCTGGIVLLPTTISESDSMFSSAPEEKDLSSVTNYGDFILNRLLLTSDPCTIPGYFDDVALSIDQRHKVVKLAEVFTEFLNVKCDSRCDFDSFLWLRDSQIQFYITELSVHCDEHAFILSEAFIDPVLSLSADSGSSTDRSDSLSCRRVGEEAAQSCSSPFPTNKLDTFCGPPVQPESCFKFQDRVCYDSVTLVECLGTIVNKLQHLSSIEVSDTDDSICDLLHEVANPGNCSLHCIGVMSLTSDGAVHLASLLPRFNNIYICHLDLKECNCESVSTLTESITRATVTILYVTPRYINVIPEEALTLGRSLSKMSRLNQLCLVGKGNSRGGEEMESFLGGFKEKIPLETLSFRCFCAGSYTAPLRDSFRLFPDMRNLFLNHLQINEDGITVLAEGFRHLPNLRWLNLSDNPLGHGVRSVMSHIMNLPKLYVLDLSNTGCTEEDVECFHECFAHLPNLKELNLSYNPLGHGVRSVMSHITNLPKLESLYLGNTGCTEKDAECVHECFTHLPNLKKLSLPDNPLGHGVRSVVSHNTTFPKSGELNLRNTGCSEEDVRLVRETIKSRQLQHVVVVKKWHYPDPERFFIIITM